MMREAAQEAFWRVQRFATDWHANSFAGSVVRRITRGMWALDLLNDTVVLAFVPALLVLFGSAVDAGLALAGDGRDRARSGRCAYLALSRRPDAALCRAGGPAVQPVGHADRRRAGRCDRVQCRGQGVRRGKPGGRDRSRGILAKWQRRTRRTWTRGTNSNTAQFAALLVLRTTVVGTALLFWWQGRATPGDVTYVLTAYFVVHGYLRDLGHHIGNLQRCVNDMEEMVALHAEPLGIADRRPARDLGDQRRPDRGSRTSPSAMAATSPPLYDRLTLTIAPASGSGWSGIRARASRPSSS